MISHLPVNPLHTNYVNAALKMLVDYIKCIQLNFKILPTVKN